MTSVSLEFGTYDPFEVFAAMQLENCLHHHGELSAMKSLSSKEKLLRAFYPKAREWRESTWWTANIIINQALAQMDRR